MGFGIYKALRLAGLIAIAAGGFALLDGDRRMDVLRKKIKQHQEPELKTLNPKPLNPKSLKP